jgi:hypothetical protein
MANADEMFRELNYKAQDARNGWKNALSVSGFRVRSRRKRLI